MIKKTIKRILGLKLLEIRTRLLYFTDKNKRSCFQKNEVFKDKYLGKRCFIMGNGPSLKELDFSLLKDEYTFTVNQIPRNPNYSKLNNNFHLWSDDVFFNINKNKPEDIELLEVMKSVNTGCNKPAVFYRYSAKDMIEEFHLEDDLEIYYFEDSNVDLSKINRSEIKFTNFLPSFKTVVHYAICLAVYMGFKEIILLGCDCSSIITLAQSRLGQAEKSYYGYQVTENDKKRLEKMELDRTFDDELHSQAIVIETYGLLSKYCQSRGAKLYNATNPTLLDSVDRITLNEALSKTL